MQLPSAARNPLSLLGAAIATAMAVLFLVLLALELLGYLTNPYIGLLVFVTVPVGFVVGLLLIPIGAWWHERRRRGRPDVPVEWPVLDLRQPRQRTALLAVFGLTVVNVVIVSMATYGGVHYMESSAFCGTTCHVTMEPHYESHQAGAHARVACAQCHIGTGAGAFVGAKLAGTRQLYQFVTNQVPRPVPTPARLISPASGTCEQCHSPGRFSGDIVRRLRTFASDQDNSESVTALLMHVGGSSAAAGAGQGIHWHINADTVIEYAVGSEGTSDTIPYVRLRDRTGQVREYVAEGVSPGGFAQDALRRMDCVDCHNRPAHAFASSPEQAVDQMLAQGRLPRELPYVRRETVEALTPEYPDTNTALARIEQHLREFYRTNVPAADPALVAGAVATAQDAWSINVFPAMQVTWGTYPNQLGHVNAPGCFRCHDDGHRTPDGRVIRQDCELCHTILPE